MPQPFPIPEGLPEFARWMNPLMRALRELGGSARPTEVVDRVASNEAVTDAELDQTNATGGQKFSNQVHWARFYLVQTGYLESSRRGVWNLSEAGQVSPFLSRDELALLIRNVQEMTRGQNRVPSAANAPPQSAMAAADPAQIEQTGAAPDGAALGDYRVQLLDVLQRLSAAGFERLCQRILREAGFQQVTVTGRSGDGGIDGHGVLSVNHFVGFRVLFQCKRYTGSVGSGHVRDFRGAMQGRADKGLILTTGNFTADARRESSRDGVPPIELVDGERLIELLSDLELGLRPITTFEVDRAFFAEYEEA